MYCNGREKTEVFDRKKGVNKILLSPLIFGYIRYVSI